MRGILFGLMLLMQAQLATAQTRDITVATVTREPFSMQIDGQETGFSIELMALLAQELDLSVTYDRRDSFAEMLDAVATGQVDAASLAPLLGPFPADEMEAHPVSTLVNSPARDTVEMIQSV